MRENGKGWMALALLMTVRVLTADDVLAGEVTLRRTNGTTAAASRRVIVSIPDCRLAVLHDDRVVRGCSRERALCVVAVRLVCYNPASVAVAATVAFLTWPGSSAGRAPD
jgi:hypothetical protein